MIQKKPEDDPEIKAYRAEGRLKLIKSIDLLLSTGDFTVLEWQRLQDHGDSDFMDYHFSTTLKHREGWDVSYRIDIIMGYVFKEEIKVNPEKTPVSSSAYRYPHSLEETLVSSGL